jgi:hypothetical protein
MEGFYEWQRPSCQQAFVGRRRGAQSNLDLHEKSDKIPPLGELLKFFYAACSHARLWPFSVQQQGMA